MSGFSIFLLWLDGYCGFHVFGTGIAYFDCSGVEDFGKWVVGWKVFID